MGIRRENAGPHVAGSRRIRLRTGHKPGRASLRAAIETQCGCDAVVGSAAEKQGEAVKQFR